MKDFKIGDKVRYQGDSTINLLPVLSNPPSYWDLQELKSTAFSLVQKCEPVICFQFEGFFFIGDMLEAINGYLIEKTSDSFLTWAQKRYNQLNK